MGLAIRNVLHFEDCVQENFLHRWLWYEEMCALACKLYVLRLLNLKIIYQPTEFTVELIDATGIIHLHFSFINVYFPIKSRLQMTSA